MRHESGGTSAMKNHFQSQGRRLRKSALVALASLGLAVTMGAVATTNAAADPVKMPKSKIKIALIPGGPNVYFAPWAKAAEAEFESLGGDGELHRAAHSDIRALGRDEHDRVAGRQGLQRLCDLP